MKKFIVFILVTFLSVFVLSADGIYSINTLEGIKTLKVPEGMTLEQAYCAMAVMYYNEKIEHDKLIESSGELASEVDNYVAKVDSLNESYDKLFDDYKKLQEDYVEIVKLYKKNQSGVSIQRFLGGSFNSPYKFDGDKQVSALVGVKFGSLLTYAGFGLNQLTLAAGVLF